MKQSIRLGLKASMLIVVGGLGAMVYMSARQGAAEREAEPEWTFEDPGSVEDLVAGPNGKAWAEFLVELHDPARLHDERVRCEAAMNVSLVEGESCEFMVVHGIVREDGERGRVIEARSSDPLPNGPKCEALAQCVIESRMRLTGKLDPAVEVPVLVAELVKLQLPRAGLSNPEELAEMIAMLEQDLARAEAAGLGDDPPTYLRMLAQRRGIAYLQMLAEQAGPSSRAPRVPAPLPLSDDQIRVYLSDGCSASAALLRDLQSTPELAALFFPVQFADVESDFGREVCELQRTRPSMSSLSCERVQSDARAELAGMEGVVVAYPQFGAEGRVIRVFEGEAFLARHGLERTDTGGLRLRMAE